MEMRIDKWLWTVRIFKTRTMAADECRKGRVIVSGIEVKPSRPVHVNDIIVIRKPPLIFTYRVKAITERRLPAREVGLYLENLTLEDELSKLDMIKLSGMLNRPKGTGRPTKRERRNLDDFSNTIY